VCGCCGVVKVTWNSQDPCSDTKNHSHNPSSDLTQPSRNKPSAHSEHATVSTSKMGWGSSGRAHCRNTSDRPTVVIIFLSDHTHILTGPRLRDILNTRTARLCLKYHMASSRRPFTGHLYRLSDSLMSIAFCSPHPT
jgi:hypothetical protein